MSLTDTTTSLVVSTRWGGWEWTTALLCVFPFTFLPSLPLLLSNDRDVPLGIFFLFAGCGSLYGLSNLRFLTRIEIRWDVSGFQVSSWNRQQYTKWDDVEEVSMFGKDVHFRLRSTMSTPALLPRMEMIRYRRDYVPFYRELARRFPKELADYRFPP